MSEYKSTNTDKDLFNDYTGEPKIDIDALIAERDGLLAKYNASLEAFDHEVQLFHDVAFERDALKAKLEIAKEALRIISEKTTTATTTTSANPFIKMEYFSTEEASIAQKALKQLEIE